MTAPSICLAGVMGYPVAQSRSPMLHNHWMAQYGLTGAYVPLAVQPEGLIEALRALPSLGFAGCNITMPHKQDAIDVMDRVDPLVRRVGAMNCVVVGKDGSLTGLNNDGFGYIASIREKFADWRADAGPIVVLGAGGGARAIVAALADEGAREIRLINRTKSRADRMAADYGAPVRTYDWADRSDALDGAQMVVNTTSQGMAGQPPLEIDLYALPKTAICSDIIYAPRETPFLAAGRARGNPTVNGLGMLLNQARPAFKAWFGIMPEITPELRAKIEASIA